MIKKKIGFFLKMCPHILSNIKSSKPLTELTLF